jgi:hypothetical protein
VVGAREPERGRANFSAGHPVQRVLACLARNPVSPA